MIDGDMTTSSYIPVGIYTNLIEFHIELKEEREIYLITMYTHYNSIYGDGVKLDGFVAEVGSQGSYKTCSSNSTKVYDDKFHSFQLSCSNYRIVSGDTIRLSKQITSSDGNRLIIDEIKVYGGKKLSAAGIALIVIGTFALIIVGVGIFIFWRRKRRNRMSQEAVGAFGGVDERREMEATRTCHSLEDQTRERGQREIPADSVISNFSPPTYTNTVNVHREDNVPCYQLRGRDSEL